jgi:hypothetical protein
MEQPQIDYTCDCEEEFVVVNVGAEEGPIEDIKCPELREMAHEAATDGLGG